MSIDKYFDIEWTHAARDDLDEIIDYISLDSINKAIKINDRLVSKVDTIERFPSRGRIVPELKKLGIKSYHEIISPPYRIMYKIEESKSLIMILGIFDGRRDLETILIDRLFDD
ncbi:type II toxin-antitoxin system RelE/ParE family toxin [candidate division KSB1 bacterium]|nr:type II toxin-antitoxin system RelE/ParE family toxin [candidate division KSB1 bacterium]MBL7093722.1 type II toxin-antitoxin system RelE/ParE family toxin [candidate division KSB1 bacterium]